MKNIFVTLGLVLLPLSIPAAEVPPRDAIGSNGPAPLVVPAFSAKSSERIELDAVHHELGKPDGLDQIGYSRRDALGVLTEAERGFTWKWDGRRYVARLDIRSTGARALRTGVRLAEVPAGLQLVASNGYSEGVRFPLEVVQGVANSLIWTPVTSGDLQQIELTYVGHAIPPAAHVADISHLTTDPIQATAPKVLNCHRNYTCVADATIQAVGRAVAKLIITNAGGQSFVCSGALLNDRANSGTPWFATADHCGINTSSIAANLQLIWFYELGCDSNTPAVSTTTIGSQLIFTDARTDFTLLRITGPLPSGLRLLGWNSVDIGIGTAVAGIHHPAGAFKAVSGGNKASDETVTFRGGGNTWTIASQEISWSSGVTEGGSSGSPLVTSDGAYRGALSAGPINASCATATRAYYSRFSAVYPKIRTWIDPIQPSGDDWPDSAALAASQSGFTTTTQNGQLNTPSDQDWFKFVIPQQGVIFIFSSNAGTSQTDTYGRIFASNGSTVLSENDDADSDGFGGNFLFAARVAPGTYYLQVTGFQGATGPYVLNSLYASDDDHSDFHFLGTPLAVNGPTLQGQISKAGDADSFVIDVTTSGTLNLQSAGTTDVVGFLYDSRFNRIADDDDIAPSNLNFGISRQVGSGRYYLVIVGYDVTTRGAYSVSAQMATTSAGVNLTGLWWNPNESGWGINFNHQSDIVFGTLFTYAPDGSPMWLVASDLRRQSDGTYSGALYRARGPAYYLGTWGSVTLTQVGTMRVVITGGSLALTYSIDGLTVTKTVERQVFAAQVPNCSFATGSRSGATNFQDLWWNPSEPGWGINFAHQGSILFGTLFVYGLNGQDRWFVASGMVRQPDGSFTGELYFTNGPAWNSVPWAQVSVRPVGTVTVRFTNGESGVLSYTIEGTSVTKSIVRQVFGVSPTVCQ